MGDKFQIQLSSKEILTAAALLGYESVFGFDESPFLKEPSNIKSVVRQQVGRLEQKNLVRYDLSGVLYVAPGLRKIIDCICNADFVGLFSTNLTSGKKSSVYVMEKGAKVVTLECLKDGKYIMRLTDSLPLQEIIPDEILSSQHQDLKEMMLFEEAEFVHKQIEAFDLDDAERQIQKHMKNADATGVIKKILSGNCGYMNIQIYHKRKELYNAVYNTLLVAVDSHTVALSEDENRVIRFESVAPARVVEQIGLQFNPG